uniref:Uncharacterized protein n=1 Tax=Vitrella brassicaformis TaxID=1169539 RepID=A0A7S1JNE7_9ALVE|mmetsp:Transcript_16917/g.40602  ORF Transcript_16917/g.40602 Transcript_16917/m.40602 type:complete len:137 (+) Transcript_16917:100-510(+)
MRRIYVRNTCHETLHIAIRMRAPGGFWISQCWWKFRPHEGNFLGDENGRRLYTDNGLIYYYAESATKLWSGKYTRTCNGRILGMREHTYVDSDGDVYVQLWCNNRRLLGEAFSTQTATPEDMEFKHTHADTQALEH